MERKVPAVKQVACRALLVALIISGHSLPLRAQIFPNTGPSASASPAFASLPVPLPPVNETPPNPESVATPPPMPQSASCPVGQTQLATLEDFQRAAMANNPTLGQAAARVQAQRGNWVQQGLYPNPRLMYKGDEMGDSNTAGFQGFSVAQEIVTTGKLGLAQNVASQQIAQAEQEFAAQEMRVQNDVKLRFYDVLLAQRALELNSELERISRAAAETADNLFKANQVGRGDVLQSRVEADTIQLQSVKARNAQQSAWRRLAAVVGLPDIEPRPLAGDLRQGIANFTWEESWARLAAGSPELAAAQAKLAAARFAVQKARADRFQNWDVEGGYSHDNSTGFDTGGIAVTLPLPLFNRNQGGISQAQAELNAAQAEVDRVALDLRNRLALTFERYGNAREMSQRYERNILPNAKESIEVTNRLYQAGETNFPALLLAQRVYLQTQVSYLDALRELRETSVLLEGQLLSDSLPGAGK